MNKRRAVNQEESNGGWELTIGVYPGILFGIRTYEYDNSKLHVLYIPFIDIALEIFD
jgi:hypothetical protein